MILGIDPGLSGALALYDENARAVVEIHDVPTLIVPKAKGTKREVDLYALARIIDNLSHHCPTVWIERLQVMPGNGQVGTFDLGRTYGMLLGVCAASFLPIQYVSPQVWKKALGLRGGQENKDESRAKASSIIPLAAHRWPLKKHEGRAEATLIAIYGARKSAAAFAA